MRVSGHASDAKGGTLELIIQPIPEEPGAPTGQSTSVKAIRNQPAEFAALPVVALPRRWRGRQIVSMLNHPQSVAL